MSQRLIAPTVLKGLPKAKKKKNQRYTTLIIPDIFYR